MGVILVLSQYVSRSSSLVLADLSAVLADDPSLALTPELREQSAGLSLIEEGDSRSISSGQAGSRPSSFIKQGSQTETLSMADLLIALDQRDHQKKLVAKRKEKGRPAESVYDRPLIKLLHPPLTFPLIGSPLAIDPSSVIVSLNDASANSSSSISLAVTRDGFLLTNLPNNDLSLPANGVLSFSYDYGSYQSAPPYTFQILDPDLKQDDLSLRNKDIADDSGRLIKKGQPARYGGTNEEKGTANSQTSGAPPVPPSVPPSPSQADFVTISMVNASLTAASKQLEGIVISNGASSPVTIDKLILSWTNNSSANLDQIKLGSFIVWNKTNQGSPSGSQPSGTLLDLVDFTLPASSSITLSQARFSSAVSGSSFTLTLQFSDGSTATASTAVLAKESLLRSSSYGGQTGSRWPFPLTALAKNNDQQPNHQPEEEISVEERNKGTDRLRQEPPAPFPQDQGKVPEPEGEDRGREIKPEPKKEGRQQRERERERETIIKNLEDQGLPLPIGLLPPFPAKPFFQVDIPSSLSGSQKVIVYSDASVEVYQPSSSQSKDGLRSTTGGAMTDSSSYGLLTASSSPVLEYADQNGLFHPYRLTTSQALYQTLPDRLLITHILHTLQDDVITVVTTLGADNSQSYQVEEIRSRRGRWNKENQRTITLPIQPPPSPDTAGYWITAPQFKMHFINEGIDQLYLQSYQNGMVNLVAKGEVLILTENKNVALASDISVESQIDPKRPELTPASSIATQGNPSSPPGDICSLAVDPRGIAPRKPRCQLGARNYPRPMAFSPYQVSGRMTTFLPIISSPPLISSVHAQTSPDAPANSQSRTNKRIRSLEKDSFSSLPPPVSNPQPSTSNLQVLENSSAKIKLQVNNLIYTVYFSGKIYVAEGYEIRNGTNIRMTDGHVLRLNLADEAPTLAFVASSLRGSDGDRSNLSNGSPSIQFRAGPSEEGIAVSSDRGRSPRNDAAGGEESSEILRRPAPQDDAVGVVYLLDLTHLNPDDDFLVNLQNDFAHPDRLEFIKGSSGCTSDPHLPIRPNDPNAPCFNANDGYYPTIAVQDNGVDKVEFWLRPVGTEGDPNLRMHANDAKSRTITSPSPRYQPVIEAAHWTSSDLPAFYAEIDGETVNADIDYIVSFKDCSVQGYEIRNGTNVRKTGRTTDEQPPTLTNWNFVKLFANLFSLFTAPVNQCGTNTIIFQYLGEVTRKTRFYLDPIVISNGANALDALGQYDDNSSTPGPIFTKSVAHNGPNMWGLNFATSHGAGLVFDTTNKRLFLADATNNRVLVYNLNSDTTLTDRVPDFVLGQANFYTNTAATTQSGFTTPRGLAYDASNTRLFVVESFNNRVLVYNFVSGITNGMNASSVLGQSSFTANASGLTQTGLNSPRDLEYDSGNTRLYVADNTNNRLLVYNLASGVTNNMNASSVLGQSSFTASGAATSQAGMSSIRDLAYDSSNSYLFVTETTNNRVTVFNLASGITNGMNASSVLGQANFTSSTSGNTQSGFNTPTAVAYDSSNTRLFVGQGTDRVTVFNFVSGITNGMNASSVLGQTNFTNTGANATQAGLGDVEAVAYNASSSQLFVAEDANSRTTIFNLTNGITNGQNASDALGQYDDNSSTPGPIFTKSGVNNGSNMYGLSGPEDILIDLQGKRLFVSESTNNRVLVYNLTAGGALLDRVPDFVLGKANFYTRTSDNTQSGMSAPIGLAYDSSNTRLFVADSGGNRLLVFNLTSGVTSGMNASSVLGQSSFTASGGATTQTGFRGASDAVFDSVNQYLFVADRLNDRILVFNLSQGIANNMNASSVLGQTSFTVSSTAVTQSGLDNPSGLAYDASSSRLFSAEDNNVRVLVFNLASGITNTMNASSVLGQSSFTANASAISQTGLSAPSFVDYDSAHNRLFVNDETSNRALVYNVSTVTNGEAAVNVLGQSSFTASAAATTQTGLSGPRGLAYDTTNKQLWAADAGNNRLTLYDVAVPVTGKVYSDAGVTALANVTVGLVTNGSSSIAVASTTSASDGAYSLMGFPYSAGDVLTVYLDGNAAKGATITVATSSPMTGMDLYQNYLITRCDNTCSLTTANLITAHNSDSDLSEVYATSTNAITASSTSTLYVPSGQTFAPGAGTTINANALTVSGGTLTQTSAAINTTSTVTLSSGTWNGGSGTLTANGLATLSGGTLTASSGAQTFNAGLTVSGGTFTGSTGAVSSTNVTLSSGTLTAPSSTGSFLVSGNWSQTGGAFTPATSTVTFTKSSGTQTLNSGGTAFYNLTHSGAGILQLATNSSTVANAFTNSGGTFDANGLSLTANGLATVSGGSLSGLTATSTFNSGLTISGGTFTGSSGTVSSTNVTFSSGTLTAPSGSFFISGNWNQTGGTFTPGTNIVTFTKSSGTQTLDSGSSAFYNLTHSGAGTLQMSTSTLTVSSTLSNSAGTFDANGLAATITSAFTLSSGTYLASTATQTFNAGLTVSGGTFTGSSGTVSSTNVTVSSGTLTAPSGNLRVAGDFTHSGGTFTHNSGAVILTGANQTLSGASTFNNLTKTVATSRTLTFPSGSGNTQTIVGTMTLQGASGQTLSLRSDSGGTQWRIDPQGTRTISYLDVKDSNNVNTTAIDATDGTHTNSGNNTNWTFPSTGSDPSQGLGSTARVSPAAEVSQSAYTIVPEEGDGSSSAVPASPFSFVRRLFSSARAADSALPAGKRFLLHLLLHVSRADLGWREGQFRLQAAVVSPDGAIGLYRDLSAETPVRFADIPDYADGAPLYQTPFQTKNVPDHHGDPISHQSFVERNPFLTSVSSVRADSDGHWVFSLSLDPALSPQTSYRLRAVRADGSPLTAYLVHPQITVSPIGVPPTAPSGESGAAIAPSRPPPVGKPIPPEPSLIEKLGEKIIEVITAPFTGKPRPPVIPLETPLVFRGEWDLILQKPARDYALAPLPEDLAVMTAKFPQLKNVFSAVGLTTLNQVTNLTSSQLAIPSLSEAVSIPVVAVTGAGLSPAAAPPQPSIPLARLSTAALKRLPSEAVFARSVDETIDFNLSLSVTSRGRVEQSISTVVNQPFKLVVKTDGPAKRVTGTVVILPADEVVLRSSPEVNNLLAAAPAALDAALAAGGNRQFVLQQFQYHRVRENLYAATVNAPAVDGRYQIITDIEYWQPNRPSAAIKIIALVDPEGYVFTRTSRGETRVAGAEVILYQRTGDPVPEQARYGASGGPFELPQGKQKTETTERWTPWPAEQYQQQNPQTTGPSGRYSFLVPAGQYYLTVAADGYLPYRGRPFPVARGAPVHLNLELRPLWWSVAGVNGKVAALIALLWIMTVVVLWKLWKKS